MRADGLAEKADAKFAEEVHSAPTCSDSARPELYEPAALDT